MPRPPNPTTPEAKLLSDAMKAQGSGAKARMAEALGVTPGAVSQYASGSRPIPWHKATQVAVAVGLLPEQISPEYRRIIERFGPPPAGRLNAESVRSVMKSIVARYKDETGRPIDLQSETGLKFFAESFAAEYEPSARPSSPFDELAVAPDKFKSEGADVSRRRQAAQLATQIVDPKVSTKGK